MAAICPNPTANQTMESLWSSEGIGCEVEEIDYTQSRTMKKSRSTAGMRSVADPVLGGRKKDG